MAYKNTQLIPVKRMVHRKGQQPFEMTVYVKAYNMKKVKDGVTAVEIPESDWAKIKTVDDFLAIKDTIFNNDDLADKEVLKKEFIEFLSKCGVTWQRDQDIRQDWMRCAMATKKAIKNGTFYTPNTTVKPKEKQTPYVKMKKADARTIVTALSKKFGSKKLVEMIEKEGITYDKNDQDYINTMHACMALREHLEAGLGFSPINDKLIKNPDFKKEEKKTKAKAKAPKKKEKLTSADITLVTAKFPKLHKTFVRTALKNGWKIEDIPLDPKLGSATNQDGYRFTDSKGNYFDVTNRNWQGGYFKWDIRGMIDGKLIYDAFHTQSDLKNNLLKFLEPGEPINHDYIVPKEPKVTSDGTFATKNHELYSKCSTLGKAVAFVTGIVPEGEEATNYLLKRIENGDYQNDAWNNPYQSLPMHDNFKSIVNDKGLHRLLVDHCDISGTDSWGHSTSPAIMFREIFERSGMLKEYEKFSKDIETYHKTVSVNLANLSTYHITQFKNSLEKLKEFDKKDIFSMKNETTGNEHFMQVFSMLNQMTMMNDTEIEKAWDILGLKDYFTKYDCYLSSPFKLMSDLSLGVLGESISIYDIVSKYEKETGKKVPFGASDYTKMNILLQNTSKQELVMYMMQVMAEKLKSYENSYEIYKKNPHIGDYKVKRYKNFMDEGALDFACRRNLSTTSSKYFASLMASSKGGKDHLNDPDTWWGDDNDPKYDHTFEIDKALEVLNGQLDFHKKHFESEESKLVQHNIQIIRKLRGRLTQAQRTKIQTNYKIIDKDTFKSAIDNGKIQETLFKHLFVNIKAEKSQKSAKKKLDLLMGGGNGSDVQMGNLAKMIIDGNAEKITEDMLPDHSELDEKKLKISIHPIPKDELEKIKTHLFASDLNNGQIKHKQYDAELHHAFALGEMNYHDEFVEIEKQKDNTKLLYHGTAYKSSQAILGQSGEWKITGKGLDITGKMIGDGVYFASQAKKAAQYMEKGWGLHLGMRGAMFLCKVSRGKMHNCGYHNDYAYCQQKFNSGIDTIECTKPVKNPEWAVKNTHAFIPLVLMDVELVKKGEGNCRKAYNGRKQD